MTEAIEYSYEELYAEVEACTACPLHESRTRPVVYRGDPNPDILFIGEAPGKDEDTEENQTCIAL